MEGPLGLGLELVLARTPELPEGREGGALWIALSGFLSRYTGSRRGKKKDNPVFFIFFFYLKELSLKNTSTCYEEREKKKEK